MATWDPKGKFAIVTGAGSGINFAFAEQLLLAGTSVIIADIALRPESEELIAKFPHPAKDGAPSAVFHKCDQSDWSSISETWEFSLKTFGRIDLLCPGAGIWEPPHSAFWNPPGISPLAKDDANATTGIYKIIGVNLVGPIRFAQIALDYWFENKIAGNLIVVSSQSAYLPTVGTPLYNATKGGLAAFAQSLAQFKARYGIRVACMCPSVTWTPAVTEDYCKSKIRDFDMNMTATECAEVMLRIVSEEEFGNGDVVEAMQFGKEKSDVKVRKVPFHLLLPPVDFANEFSGKNIMAEEEKLYEQLKTKGMRP
ncbi:short chain dehydrogenase reductase [Xylariales sp. PMI_506]|nr:short chain dehydrogenase reductase [Xylariales sp. PMI_506]